MVLIRMKVDQHGRYSNNEAPQPNDIRWDAERTRGGRAVASKGMGNGQDERSKGVNDKTNLGFGNNLAHSCNNFGHRRLSFF